MEGLGHLPKNCLALCAGFFFAAILMAVARLEAAVLCAGHVYHGISLPACMNTAENMCELSFCPLMIISAVSSLHCCCCCCRDWGRPAWLFKYVPVPMAMGIPAVVGAWLAVDMCVGGVILFVWEKFNFEAVSAPPLH